MKIQQTAINHSPDTNFDEFKRLYRNFTAKKYSFLLIDTTLPSENPFRFRKNLLQEVHRVIMTFDDKIRDETLFDIYMAAAKNMSIIIR